VKCKIRHVHRLLGPIAVPMRESSTNSREVISMTLVCKNCSPSTARRGGAVIARCREQFTTKAPAAMWLPHSQLTSNLKPTYFRRMYGYEEHDFVTGSQKSMLYHGGGAVEAPSLHQAGWSSCFRDYSRRTAFVMKISPFSLKCGGQ
jgi:hypothetical protein